MDKPRFDLTYYIPVSPDGSAIHWLMRQRRKDTVADTVGERQFFRADQAISWESLRRDGWRIAKVRIVPVEG